MFWGILEIALAYIQKISNERIGFSESSLAGEHVKQDSETEQMSLPAV